MIVKKVEESSAEAGCCGGPALSPGACCVADEQARASGQDGCGCSPAQAVSEKPKSSCCN